MGFLPDLLMLIHDLIRTAHGGICGLSVRDRVINGKAVGYAGRNDRDRESLSRS